MITNQYRVFIINRADDLSLPFKSGRDAWNNTREANIPL